MLHKQPNNKNILFGMKRFLSLILLAGITIDGFSQRILSLDSCRNLAIQNNKELRIAGTATGAQLQQQFQQIAAANPILSSLLEPLQGMIPGLTAGLNGVGQNLVDAFRTDTRNMFAGAATLTQPLFMGGKIIAYNKITRLYHL